MGKAFRRLKPQQWGMAVHPVGPPLAAPDVSRAFQSSLSGLLKSTSARGLPEATLSFYPGLKRNERGD